MKKLFTLMLALMSIFAVTQSVSALTYNVTVPAGTKACYITGEMNGWSPAATPMTKVTETTYTIDLPNATESMKYQYLSGPDWQYIEKDASGAAITDRTWSASDVVVKWLTTFVPDERDVTIEALVPLDVKELYLVGSFNGWASPGATTKMTFVSQGVDGKIYKITVHSADAKNMEFKFCAGPAWSYQQTDPKANFVYGTTDNSTAVVVNAFEGYFDPAKTGTINITATVPAGTQQVFIQGDFLGWDMTKAIEGVKNPDGTFSFAIPMVMAIEYRLYNKPDWGYPEVDATGAERANRKSSYPTDANLAVTVINWMKIPSAVASNTVSNANVYTSNNSMVVENVQTRVQIFDLMGRLIQSSNATGDFHSKNLNAGIYLVHVDGSVQKVSVR
jgi:hypothetical protein